MKFKGLLSLILTFSLVNIVFARSSIDQTDFENFVNGVAIEALRHGISDKTLRHAFHHIRPVVINPIKPLSVSAPHMKPGYQGYIDFTVTPTRIAKARAYMTQHRNLLRELADRYNVQPEYIVAIWGLETDFGRIQGNYPEIATLATLAYSSKRKTFFRQELMAALRILDKGIISLKRMKGSWAGAMGQCQLLPEEYLRFSVDYDGCGQHDIWNSTPDALASIANYLHYLGWNHHHGLAEPVLLPPDFYSQWRGFNDMRSVNEWTQVGMRDMAGHKFQNSASHTLVIAPTGLPGPSYLVYLDNFRATYRWNHSDFYVMSVALLANAIRV